jgi:diguanylate cyclase (GGDEF)-like protein
MPPEKEHAIAIEEVEREIAAGTRRLLFAPRIEAEYERASTDRRSRVLITTGIIAVVLYDLFLLADWVTLNDRFAEMALVRLGIFTPVVIWFVSFLYRRKPDIRVAEMMGCVSGILGVLLPMAVMISSDSPHRLNYQYGSLLVIMFSTIVQRLSFRVAVLGLCGMLCIQLLTTYLSGAFDAETYLGIALFFVTACVLMAVTTYFLEYGDRLGFLLALRGKLLSEQMEALARTDPLTGLFNRRHLADLTGKVWGAAEAQASAVSVILIDIDHFKVFNDSRGHLEGDACLRVVSACVAKVAEARGGFAFRFGGEEMLVLLPGSDLAAARQAAEAIRAAIEAASIPHPAIGGFVTASIGAASGLAPRSEAAALIAEADAALYEAKSAGRNRVFAAAERPGLVTPEIEAAAA